MFAALKNKIKTETGAEIEVTGTKPQTQRSTDEHQNRFADEVNKLRSKCNDLRTKAVDLASDVSFLQKEKTSMEWEIDKLKNLLKFREQEALDRLNALGQYQKQIESLTAEMERLKRFEPMAENLKDELQTLQHASQQDRMSLTTTLAVIAEENRHLKKRLEICEKARLESINKLKPTEQLRALINERKLLEQQLEEAHVQLSDIKSSWSGQNLALETQVSRLSKQVAEETTEKRKAITARDDLMELIKQLEFDMLKLKNEIQQKDDKIQLLEDENDELKATLKETREENEQQLLFERNKVATLETTIYDLKTRLSDAEERYNEHKTNAGLIQKTLRQQIDKLETQLHELQSNLDTEKEEKLKAILRNAEISQSEEKLKVALRNESDENYELHEQQSKFEADIKAKKQEVQDLRIELTEKNKAIKMLNQRLADLKKTLEIELRGIKPNEFINNNGGHVTNFAIKSAISISSIASNSSNASSNAIIMDEVNFKYLKHVIIKFLTSPEVEVNHLMRALATLLQLTKEEEKLLCDTLNWKTSWFGSKPTNIGGQNANSSPQS